MSEALIDRLNEHRRKFVANNHTCVDGCPIHFRVVCGCIRRCRPCETEGRDDWLVGRPTTPDPLTLVRDTKRCIVHDETYTTVCRGCRADEIAVDDDAARRRGA